MTAIAVSIAGHDTGKSYLVIGEDLEGRLMLVNGSTRPLSKPKYKKKKHIRLAVHLREDLKQQIRDIETDSDIRKVLKAWENRETRVSKNTGQVE